MTRVDLLVAGSPPPWAESIRSLRIRAAVGSPATAEIVLSAPDADPPSGAAALQISIAGVHVGSFVARSVRGDSLDGSIAIDAAAVGEESGELLWPRDRAWAEQTLMEMAADVARDAGLELEMQAGLGGRVCALGRQQVAESDYAFLARVAEGFNASVTVRDGRLVVASDSPLPVLQISPAAHVSWQRDFLSPERVRATALGGDGVSVESVEVGAGERLVRLPATFPAAASALAAASSTLAAARVASHSARISTGLTPEAQLLQPVALPRIPASFPALAIGALEHHISARAPGSTTLDCRPRNSYPA